jgi:hypothetical protein
VHVADRQHKKCDGNSYEDDVLHRKPPSTTALDSYTLI